MNHGGKRKGAGRPPAPEGTKKQRMGLKIDPVLRRYLESTESITGTIEAALRRSRGFKQWKANQ